MAAATTAATATTPTLPGNLTKYYEALQHTLTKSAPQMEYNPQSADQIRQNLENAYKANYDQSVKTRKQQTQKNSAVIDADAAARGIGTSTWVTDAKRRQQDSEASDIATLTANKNATISQQLAAALSDQEARKLSVDEYNATNRATAQSNALSTAVSMYDKFKAEEPVAAAASSGGGGGGGGGGGNYRPMAQYAGTKHNDWYLASLGIDTSKKGSGSGSGLAK